MPWMFGIAACGLAALRVRRHGRGRPLNVAFVAAVLALSCLGSYLIALPPSDLFQFLVLYPIALTAIAVEWVTAAMSGWLT